MPQRHTSASVDFKRKGRVYHRPSQVQLMRGKFLETALYWAGVVSVRLGDCWEEGKSVFWCPSGIFSTCNLFWLPSFRIIYIYIFYICIFFENRKKQSDDWVAVAIFSSLQSSLCFFLFSKYLFCTHPECSLKKKYIYINQLNSTALMRPERPKQPDCLQLYIYFFFSILADDAPSIFSIFNSFPFQSIYMLFGCPSLGVRLWWSRRRSGKKTGGRVCGADPKLKRDG